MARSPALTKTCATCGRPFDWRKKWERTWDDVRYCSDACRRLRPNATDLRLEAAILQLLRPGMTICPSEAARRVGGDDWRPFMERTRRAARRLQAAGDIVITQGGRQVGPHFKGPIRLGLPR
jgi:hypothetical protein